MRAIVLGAIRAGALGFSTSRTLGHRAIDGELVPGTFAAEDELFGLGSALGEAGAGVFELAPLGSAGEMLEDAWQEVDWMRRLSAAIDRPVSYVLLQADDDPELWRKQLAASLEACAEGASCSPRSRGARPASVRAPHDAVPVLRLPRLCGAAGALRVAGRAGAALADPEVRRSVVSWTPSSPAQADAMTKAYERTFILGYPPDYEPGPERSLAVGGRQRRTPWRWPTTRWPRRRARAALDTDPQLRHRRPRPRARRCCTRRAFSAWLTAAPTPAPSATHRCRPSC